ncbi:RagB/SusD family nutrient uptake outer membrane protein [Butyricimonas synergistica]|uniref:RagB/SusD family nutrient uptake outer membrane protein n=1 Tax=Butyricimonas synergistica TaxID=544644 RepID=UPI00039A2A54|nr:RagB/SusD family nutrient uptake outer membrane protein [Butyricimonas synergistica]
MKEKVLSIICVLGILMASCSDFLDSKSQDEVIPKTTKDFRELLLGSGYPQPGVHTHPMAITSYMDDDVDCDVNNNMAGSNLVKNVFSVYTWQPDAEKYESTVMSPELASTPYYAMYERIKGCNAVLDYIDDAIGTQQEKNQIKAEALAVRALFYFWLVNLYGEPYTENPRALGVPLKLSSSVEETSIARTTVEKVYAQILEDLNKSAEFFGEASRVTTDYRINRPTVEILLSRVYLYMGNWQKAVEAATEAIRIGGELTNLTAIERAGAFACTKYSSQEVTWVYGGSVSTFKIESGLNMSTELRTAYGEDDRRMDLYYSYDADRGLYYNQKEATSALVIEGNSPGSAIRISEAYLNRAEAYVQWENKTAEALADLNKLRRNRITDYQDVSISDPKLLLDEIRLERRLEFALEGHRWLDLRRYGMPSIKHTWLPGEGMALQTYVLKEKDPMYTLPLPEAVLSINPELTQNVSAYEPERKAE